MKNQTIYLKDINTRLTFIEQNFLLNGCSKDKNAHQFSFRHINVEDNLFFATNGSRAHLIKFPYTVAKTPLYFRPKTWETIRPSENDIPLSKKEFENMLELLPFILIENQVDITKATINVIVAEILHAVVSYYSHKYCLAYQYLIDFFSPFINDKVSYTFTARTGEPKDTHPVLLQLQKDKESPMYIGLICLYRNFIDMKPLDG